MKILAALILFAICFAYSKEAPDPIALIKAKDTELQKLLKIKSKKGEKERQEKIKNLINGIFDFETLGKKSLGKKQFEALSPAKQQEFVTAFKNMIETSSLKKLEVYRSDSTNYDSPILKGEKAKVTAHTFLDGQESVLVYKLKLKNGEWKAWDLIIDDLSTYLNYKEQFKRILKTKTIDDLIQILKKKAAKPEAQ